ncbi:MAG TPA: DinB family protein, partial [Niastella sp.]|nr:DinB family protein [Niastella sp.]
ISHWDDGMLEEENNLYGDPWKKGFSLWVLLIHQTHHRGQMTVLMRMTGLKVPGIYGPSKEEWEAWGEVALP